MRVPPIPETRSTARYATRPTCNRPAPLRGTAAAGVVEGEIRPVRKVVPVSGDLEGPIGAVHRFEIG